MLSVAQIGGNSSYEFLRVPVSARSASLGGSAIHINDGDITLANENPALFTEATSDKLAIGYFNYFKGMNTGFAAYAKNLNEIGTFGFGIQHMGSGEIVKADETGAKMGTFKVSETIFKASFNRSFDSIFFIGATIKPFFANYDIYKSFALGMDIGATFTSRNKLVTASVAIKHFGIQVTSFNDTREKLPLDVQAGVSYKLEHAPFRLSLAAHHITKNFKYNYVNNSEPTNTGYSTISTDEPSTFMAIANHFILGVELLPTKNIAIRGGYNFQRRDELKLTDKGGASGFSWGLGFKIKKLYFSYANARYHFAGRTNYITITTNLSEYGKKKI